MTRQSDYRDKSVGGHIQPLRPATGMTSLQSAGNTEAEQLLRHQNIVSTTELNKSVVYQLTIHI